MGSRGTEIRFLRHAGRRVAYAVTGAGPPLVAAAWWLSHLELDELDPRVSGFWESLAAGHTLVRYDRLGVGMSDRDVSAVDLTLDAEVALLEAVVDALAPDPVVLLGGSSGGCAAVAFAARHPDRVSRLLLYGAYADGAAVAAPEVREALTATLRSHWGLGSRVLADLFLGRVDSTGRERFARYQRAAADPQTAAALLEAVYRHDVRQELSRVRAPTVVVHRRGDRAIPYRLARELAAGIPDASLVPLAGDAHFPWLGDADSVVGALRRATASGPTEPPDPDRRPVVTGREREVLALVARGLSDAEIAGQLFLSPHTVHRHVANLRRKLGRSSRAAAVAEGVRLGLV